MSADTTSEIAAQPTTQQFGRFFLPGPTEVRAEVLAAQTKPMIGHRGKGMEELIATIEPDLQYIFRTTRPVYIGGASATGFMEAAVRNGARRRVLSLVNGAFSERFFQIAVACGLHAESLTVPMGQAHTPDLVAEALARGDFDAVTVVHSETSTGALNPIADIARVVHAAGDVVVLVDSVSGIAGAELQSDAWELDFVLTGSQKALALPPGLALGVANDRLLERAAAATGRGIYFDLIEYDRYVRKNQTPNTPAISLMYALAAQLQYIRNEGIEARWARHMAMAQRTWSWVDDLRADGVAVEILAPPGFRSPTVSCIALPTGTLGSQVNVSMKKKGFTISAGYGSLKDTTIRIGHMGDHTLAELDVLLDVLREVITA
jgi:predicted phosphoserine aminotransferase